jgi:hypothetical protein
LLFLIARRRIYIENVPMRCCLLLLVALVPLCAQQLDLESYLRVLRVAPGSSIESKVKALDALGITLSQRGLRELAAQAAQPTAPSFSAPTYGVPQLRSQDGQGKYLGNLNSNRFDPGSVWNFFGSYGSPYSPDSVNNPYGQYGSPYSPYSATNPYATRAPAIVTPEGKYLGKFGANKYDPDSISNPFGRFGSPYSPDSVNNFFGLYGSPYSPFSIRNPYAPALPSLPGRPSLPSLPTLPLLPTLPSLPRR